jgi:hypothetical protein
VNIFYKHYKMIISTIVINFYYMERRFKLLEWILEKKI